MKTIIQFTIQKGEKYYTAHASDFPIFTQAETLDELIKNIGEAVELHFSNENPEESGLMKNHSLLVNFEIPKYA